MTTPCPDPERLLHVFLRERSCTTCGSSWHLTRVIEDGRAGWRVAEHHEPGCPTRAAHRHLTAVPEEKRNG